MEHEQYKCFICGKEYNQESIEPIKFEDKYQGWVKCNKLFYHGKRVYLCNEHFRMCVMTKLMAEHCDIEFEEE
jgi:hypothetical protein